MTIDKAIEEVQQQKFDYQEFWEEYKNEHIEALNMAIETMRKYQKIEELAEYHMIRFLPKERMSGFQKDILDVLDEVEENEDGNDRNN